MADHIAPAGTPLIDMRNISIAFGGIFGGYQLGSNFSPAGDFNAQIGSELPEFVDGPSVYAYARSAPGTNIDPSGEMTKRGQIIRDLIDICFDIVKWWTGSPDIKAPPRRPLPEIAQPSKPVNPVKPPKGGKGPPKFKVPPLE